MSEATHILNAIAAGDPQAAAQLLPLVYDELRRLAAHRLAQEKPGQTLEPTAKKTESVASKEAFSGHPPSPFRLGQNDNRWQMSFLYPEGVAHHSPGSQSAPWDPGDAVGSTLKGLYQALPEACTTLSG